MDGAKIEFGVAIPGTTQPAEAVRIAAWLENETPIRSLWVTDERFERDMWVTLGMVGATTRLATLGSCVTDAFIRHPALTATAAATLDELSGQRAILGLGAGISGFDALSITRQAPATAIREAIELARLLWDHPGEEVSYRGRTTSFDGTGLLLPVARRVPIYIAGRGPKILATAGELADGVLVGTFTGGPLLQHSLDQVAVGEARRDPALGALRRLSWAYVSVGEDAEMARSAVRDGIATALWGSRPILADLKIELPPGLEQVMAATSYSADPRVLHRAAELVPEDLVDDCSIAGTPAQCAEKIRSLAERGFEQVAMSLFPLPGQSFREQLEQVVRELIPRLR